MLLGLVVLAVGATALGAPFLPLPLAGIPPLALLGLVLLGPGLALTLGRIEVTVDRESGRASRGWFLHLGFGKMRLAEHFVRIYHPAQITLRAAKGKSSKKPFYPLEIEDAQGLGLFTISAGDDLSRAQKDGKAVADYLRVPFEDRRASGVLFNRRPQSNSN